MKVLGWSVEYRALDAARGGHRALLLPRLAGGFHVVVDPHPSPQERAEGVASDLVARWRLAHEYAHTFFYAPNHVPRRATAPSAAEEAFCDAFANGLFATALSSRAA